MKEPSTKFCKFPSERVWKPMVADRDTNGSSQLSNLRIEPRTVYAEVSWAGLSRWFLKYINFAPAKIISIPFPTFMHRWKVPYGEQRKLCFRSLNSENSQKKGFDLYGVKIIIWSKLFISPFIVVRLLDRALYPNFHGLIVADDEELAENEKKKLKLDPSPASVYRIT